MKERYYLSYLAENLERAIHEEVGVEGLKILLHGWLRKTRTNRQTLDARAKRDGEAWLTYYEVISFSKYAGYDLL